MNSILLGAGSRAIGLLPDPTYTDATNLAIANLRNLDLFQWYLVPIYLLVFYIYFTEIEKKNWNVLMAGLAFWGLEWFLEILNALFLYVHGHSAIWTAPADSALIITVGLNIEITMMFAFMGIVFAKVLPKDKKMKILGIPNRIFLAFFNAILCVITEIILNLWDALIWVYPWWSINHWYRPILIVIFVYLFFSFWVYDMPSMKKKVAVVSTMYAIDIVCLIVFMGILGWI